MPLFHVYVIDNTVRRYSVEADSEEEAQEKVEASDAAEKEFGFKTIDSRWSVEQVEPADHVVDDYERSYGPHAARARRPA